MKEGEEKVDFENVDQVTEKVQRAVRRAFDRHKQMKNPLPTWDGNGVKIVAPEDLPSSEAKDTSD